ncbi:MAG: lipoate--protein ligase [Clostridiales bacterium]|jgi:lipoate-protein ligase A|nr:lipoate--protein ligase [Clostridiales bacterium]
MKLRFYQTEEIDPHKNLALEKYFLDRVGDDEFIIYFWANRDTIVIGRNQYAYDQVDMQAVMEDGIKIARRLSGGGAVYHDDNNLNFSFIMNAKRFDKETGYDIILKALTDIGVPAKKSGRNDITVDGRKFSGNAFLSVGNRYCHHGTILINTDIAKMGKYLSIPKQKLSSKGVSSVQSRVLNLSEIAPEINRESIMRSARVAAESYFGQNAALIDDGEIDFGEIERLTRFFSDKRFLFGDELRDCEHASGAIDGIGLADIYFKRQNGAVSFIRIFTDSMSLPDMESVEGLFIGKDKSGIEAISRDGGAFEAGAARLLLS